MISVVVRYRWLSVNKDRKNTSHKICLFIGLIWFYRPHFFLPHQISQSNWTKWTLIYGPKKRDQFWNAFTRNNYINIDGAKRKHQQKSILALNHIAAAIIECNMNSASSRTETKIAYWYGYCCSKKTIMCTYLLTNSI